MRVIPGLLACALAAMLAPIAAQAQSTYPTRAAGVKVAGVVPLVCNAAATSCGPAASSLQGAVTTTRTTLAASTATALEAAGVAARSGESFTAEAALAANVYICTTQTTGCSATNYDFLIPSGAGAGTVYTALMGTTGRLYAYSTGTPVIVLNSWTAQ